MSINWLRKIIMKDFIEFKLFGYEVTFTYNKVWKIGSITNPQVVARYDTVELDNYILFLQFVSRQLNILNGKV